ncbi:MAG: DUF3826 domain-containing protein [Bacteroides sp.]|nr:DUF3826 domain-containing protein [Bacteroides sp.]
MKMKTKYFFMLLIACLMGAQSLSAQNKEAGKRPRKRMSIEQIVEMQSNKIVADLGLDDKTADKFKEVYKKYKTEMNDLWKKNMPKKPEVMPGQGQPKQMPTDAEVDKMMRDKFKMSRKMLDIREKYYDEFRKFLSPKQVEKIFDYGQHYRDRFQKEINRRAGMKPKDGGHRPSWDRN